MKFERLKMEPEKEEVMMSAIYTILSLILYGIGATNFLDNISVGLHIATIGTFLVGYNFKALLVNAKKYRESK